MIFEQRVKESISHIFNVNYSSNSSEVGDDKIFSYEVLKDIYLNCIIAFGEFKCTDYKTSITQIIKVLNLNYEMESKE